MKALVFIYIFTFACLFKVHATTPQPQPKGPHIQQPKDCVKHPQIVKPHTAEKPKVVTERVVKTATYRGGSSIPHFSVLNLINFFYTKDTLDNLHVM